MRDSTWVSTSTPYLTPRQKGRPDPWAAEAAARGGRGTQRIAYAGETAAPDEVAVLLGAQLLHALTFAAQHSACTALLTRHFPGRLRARGQALYAVLGYGASGVIGGIAGGAMSESWGFASVFWAASGAAIAAAWCCHRAFLVDARPVT